MDWRGWKIVYQRMHTEKRKTNTRWNAVHEEDVARSKKKKRTVLATEEFDGLDEAAVELPGPPQPRHLGPDVLPHSAVPAAATAAAAHHQQRFASGDRQGDQRRQPVVQRKNQSFAFSPPPSGPPSLSDLCKHGWMLGGWSYTTNAKAKAVSLTRSLTRDAALVARSQASSCALSKHPLSLSLSLSLSTLEGV